jgi:hypothetical protein
MTQASVEPLHLSLDEIEAAQPGAATTVALEPVQAYGVTIGRGRLEIRAASARAAAVAKMRELADALERGDLDGARIEWREGLHFLTTVEMEGRRDEPGAEGRRAAALRDHVARAAG